MKEIPKEIRTFAIKEYETGIKNSKERYEYLSDRQEFLKQKYSNYKIKEITKSEVDYRKKKKNQSITINKDAIRTENNKLYIYKKSFDDNPLQFRNRAYKKDKRLIDILKGPIYHDIKIIKNTINQYYVCFSIDVSKKAKNINENNVIGCDPGGRTFITTYNENKIMEIGKEINKQIYEINKKIDNGKGINKKKLYIKLRNKVNELHYKTINKLMKYDLIYIPKLNASFCVFSKKRWSEESIETSSQR